MPLPHLRLETGYKLHPWLERMTSYQDNDKEFENDDLRRLAIACYFALCTFVDSLIGRVLDTLQETSQTENTLVIFCSDHGECLGQRGRWGKSVLYGESTRVPLILAGPGVDSGEVCSEPVSLLDIAPTILNVLGLDIPGDWVGRSLLEKFNGEQCHNRQIFSEYHAVASPSGAFMLVESRWKFHEYVGYPSELFDLVEDPFEEINLANDPEFADELKRMRNSLHSICNPEQIDAKAKKDQDELTARFGGYQTALRIGPKGATTVAN